MALFTKIEALNFRCLRSVQRTLQPFHVLVGPNASGKTTFLDVIAFLGRLVAEGLDSAVGERTSNFQDLVWQRSGPHFEVAVEARIPDANRANLSDSSFDTLRYEVRIGTDADHETVILWEKVLLKTSGETPEMCQRSLFPAPPEPPETILSVAKGVKGTRTVINKVAGGNDNFYSEVYGESGKGWAPAFKLGSRKSALGNLPEDESKFPVSTWFKQLLTNGVQQFVLNSMLIRKASPPGQVRGFKSDGSNLPWVVEALKKADPARFADWIAHVRTALPDIEDIRTVEREDDRHRYLVICYRGGLEVPSWMASDGTLRLLALTLPAFLPDFTGVYLIEEPENGIHPRAVETMFQALSSAYNAQILMATHSPVILSIVELADVLCFAKTPEGATDIVRGTDHPALRHWKGESNLSTLFAAGVLG
jgi:predicted ATPase